MPRPYAHVRGRVCLHKSKFLGLLQNLKVTNEIVKQRNNVVVKEFMYFRVSQALSQNYGLVCAVYFQGLLQQLEVLLIHTYSISSRRWAMLLKAGLTRSPQNLQASLNNLQEFNFVRCFNLKSVQMVQ